MRERFVQRFASLILYKFSLQSGVSIYQLVGGPIKYRQPSWFSQAVRSIFVTRLQRSGINGVLGIPRDGEKIVLNLDDSGPGFMKP